MRKVGLLFLLPALLLLPTASASTRTTGTGNFTITISNMHTRSAGGNTITTQDDSLAVTGVISGTCVGSEMAVMHRDGSATSHGTCTFTGMVQGKSGTAVFGFSAVSTHNKFIGHFRNTSGSGGLAGLHLVGTFQATSPTAGTYAAQLHWDPS